MVVKDDDGPRLREVEMGPSILYQGDINHLSKR
jgi:hypothetical protein